jgi:hypothetical protein
MAKRKKKPVHPVTGLTKVQTNQRCKAAMRQVWRKTSRAKCIRDNRFPHPDPTSSFTYAVPCAHCPKIMGQSEKIMYITKKGRRRRRGAYDVNHITDTTMPPVNDIVTDLGPYADELLHTPVEIVCPECHAKITAEQRKLKFG